MKSYKYLFFVMLLLVSGVASYGQGGGYNPNDPPEPNPHYTLTLHTSPSGAGTPSGSGKYAVGTRVTINTSTVAGFRFQAWKEDDQVIATSASFQYTIPAKHTTLTAVFEYAPNNPGDPNTPNIPKRAKLFLEAQPSEGGYFNRSNGETYTEGTQVYLYAYTNSGFNFIKWMEADTLLSTSRNFYCPMGDKDRKLTAVFEYNPGNPGEPNNPQSVEHGLIALNQYGEAGQNLVFPLYLLNHNISVRSVEFDIQFPEDVTADYANTAMTNRQNGHTLSVQAMADNTYHYVISGGENDYFFDSNGILLNIPLRLPSQWTSGETYPVTLSNVNIGTSGGVVASSGKSGGLGVTQDSDYTLSANFYPNRFLNRVYFINLSTENATGFQWNFGDGSQSNEKNPLHVFAGSGNYTVRLIASNAVKADTVSVPLEIAPENTWLMSGTFSLNKHKKDIKNFTSAEELFLLLSRSAINGNVTIDVEAGEIFQCPLSTQTMASWLTIRDKLAASGNKLIFRKEGNVDDPVIDFTGTLTPAIFSALIVELGNYTEQQNVYLKIAGQVIDLGKLHDSTTQTVCSGTPSAPVDFREINPAFTYRWQLATSPSATTSGYLVSGTNVMPAMTLLNPSNQADTLKYKVSIRYSQPEVELYAIDHFIAILPLLQNPPELVYPQADETLTTTNVSLSWSPALNADSYELTVWEQYEDEPANATVINIPTNTYQSSALFQYGKSYYWKVTAVNQCKRIASETALFHIRKLPNLHVTSVEILNELLSGKEAEIAFEVKNDGPGVTLETEYWFDRIALIRDLQNPRTEAYYFAQKQNKTALASGASYRDTVKVNIPERLSGNYYVVAITDMNDVLSIDWSPVNNTVPELYTPNKSGIPYPYLKAQTSASGNRIPEDKETHTLTDNFFYAQTEVKIPEQPDLRVISIIIPDSVPESQPFTVTATVKNSGSVAFSGKTWTDAIWRSKDSGFTSNAVLVATHQKVNTGLEKEDSYTVDFDLTAPVDSSAYYYYFVTTDINDDVFEADETNNRLRSTAIKVLPYLIHEEAYERLLRFYNEFGGSGWKKKWIASLRQGYNWPGVTFDNDGQVSAISLPSNNLTGALSGTLWDFPQLTSLQLYDNQLSGDLNALFASGTLPDSLVVLNLGKNKIEGNIPASVAGATYLENLNVSYNRLTDVEQALPERITTLEIHHQSLPEDSIVLASRLSLAIPSIAAYNHTDGSFDFYPSYGLYSIDSIRILSYIPFGEQYNWLIPGLPRNFIWRYESGKEFILIQDNGLCYGNSIPLKVNFVKADANMDRLVNILDVQHSLNFIFNEHASPFNFTAADTYKDNEVTVQDLIKTVGIVLDTPQPAPLLPQEMQMRTTSSEPDNYLYIQDKKLFLRTQFNVAAMDITLQGISSEDIKLLLDPEKFQMTSTNRESGVRFIVFSLSQHTVSPGATALIELNNDNVYVVNAELSDVEANPLPVDWLRMPTGIDRIENGVYLFVNEGTVHCSLAEKADRLTLSLYSLPGIQIDKQVFNNLSAGQYSFDLNCYRQGVYILQAVVESGNRILSKNSKIIIK
jgi:PKD repeat protein